MAAPRTIVIPALKKHTATVICVHGLGDTGSGWVFLAESFRRRGLFQDVAFVFPSAPNIPITVNMGMQMPGWYDIISFDTLNRSDDEPGILRSRTYLHSLVAAELAKGIPARRVILGGFSQGGAMSVFAGLTYPGPGRLGGVFGLSCYQLLEGKFDALRKEAADAGAGEAPPVFMGHGQEDPLVRLEWGQATAEGLKKKGIEVDWHEYPRLPHSAAPEEIDDLEKWVTKRLDETKGETSSAGL
ncbi:hypothetical protein FH972_021428 [Carpinus fangiana]|uniref:Phospholipase/carboxylesterase/thioesterase domain-containing protein n=1 Tax=Carpinus fangiana TaxID=176857 RepID=A0A5N6KPN9_9ROSI|nr:hypothetical protein FH972_021428 [Carpinus fangiana]